jgi:molybdopterin-containing oxidoreductase family iron-sulfur binding subunit
MTLSDIRARLNGLEGRAYWRSLEELADTDSFKQYLHREFPVQASEFTDPAGRREFLKLMGASLALAGVSACTRQPAEDIVPYVRQPEEIIPGRPLFFATAMPIGGVGMPLLAENHMGRPTKLEGNPDHPASLGGADVLSQASVLGLYDPDRSRNVVHRGEVKTWQSFTVAMQAAIQSQRAIQGQGLRILTEPVSSPSALDQIRTLLTEFPSAKWHQWDAVYGVTQGPAPAERAIYRFDRADVIVSLDADFLGFGPGQVRYAKDFSSRRRISTPQDQLNRLYVVEPVPTITGGKADHRLPLQARQIQALAEALAAAVGAGGTAAGTGLSDDVRTRWIPAVAADLAAHKGRSVVVAGDWQPASVHAAARSMNEALGNVGATVQYGAPVTGSPADGASSLADLAADLAANRVNLLVILGGNPAFTAPADLKFAETLRAATARAGDPVTAVHLGLYHDETAELCTWHIPEAHYLESWGDVLAFDGTVSLIQPLVAPLYDGRTALEVLAVLNGMPGQPAADLVKEYWANTMGGPEALTAAWRRSLHDGFFAGASFLTGASAAAPLAAPPASPAGAPQPGAPLTAGGMEIVFRPDPNILDGRFANSGWLQELPKPLSKVTWESVAYISPRTAERLGVENGDELEVRYQGRSARLPAWVMPGSADESIVVHFGYGRRRAGRVGTGVGFDTFGLRGTGAPWFDGGADVSVTGESHQLASTQNHFAMEGRHPVRIVDRDDYMADPTLVAKQGHTPPPKTLTLYPVDHPHSEGAQYQWGMAIDLNACTGCQACVAACVAENNTPVVGKSQVWRSREMHWLRVDTYFEGGPDEPAGVYHQPVPCMQCENAPCEVVCPVAATVHSDEGLNDMVYNRCVGTRYCSNNCPYKVRRFNFMLYSDFSTPELQAQRNPDVTIRSRGVMEKCTYCVQRINQARIDAKTEGRQIRDGEIRTACQQTCPADAIVFGNLLDTSSKVVQLKQQQRNYGLLEDLGTRPRTSYLAVVRNPNPALG